MCYVHSLEKTAERMTIMQAKDAKITELRIACWLCLVVGLLIGLSVGFNIGIHRDNPKYPITTFVEDSTNVH